MIIQSEPLTTSEESSSLDVATPINGCTEPSARKELVQASAVTPTGNLSPAHQPRCPSPSPSEHLITSPPPPVDLSQLTPVIVVRKGTEAVPIQKKLEVSSKSQPRTRKASKKRSTAYSTALQPTTAVDHPYARSCISNTNKPSPTKKQRSKLSAKQTTQLNPTDKVNNLQSDCFKRFYLQRQPDGKIVLVTQEEGTKPPKPLNSMLNADKLPHHLLLVNDSLVLDQVEEESKPSQMSTILQPTSQSHLSTNEPLVLSSSQQQTLAILSALKHDHPLLSMAASNYSQITSSTPTTSKKVDGLTPGSASHSNNTLEQNMLVASLPPVETIFGDRSLSLTHSSMQMLDQPDQTMANTSYNTIINDHHIDYYGQVDSTVDDEDEILSNSKYLPFGYFYDDEKELNQLISSSLPSSTTPSPLLDGVDLPHCTDRVKDIAGGNEEFAAFPNEVPFEFGNNNNNACETGYGASSESSVGHIMSNDTHQINSLIKQEKDDFPKMYLNRQFSHDQFNLDSSLADSSVFHDLYNTNETISAMGKSISPVIGKAQEPTLAQLNMPFHIEKEEDEDEIICWTNMEQDAFGNSFVPHSSNLLECGKVVDLNSQQQNLITSSTSPTSKHAPRSEVWLSSASTTQNAAPSKTVTISNSNVSSTMVEEFVVPDVVDDTSLEIEAIFRQSQQASTSCGSQKMFTSPPQISSSFGLKCQSIKMKPQLIAMSNGSEKQTLLSELLSNKNLSASNLIHSAKPNSRGFNQNLVSNPLPILAKNFNHHYVNVPKLENGNKSSLKCPTLAALISSPNVSINNNSMLNVTSGQPMSMNFSTGCGMTMITTHNSRIRNNSMSTDYSVSSHDEGFASQPDEEFEDSEPDDMMILQDNTDDLIDTDLFLIDGQNMLNLNCSVVDEPMYASANLATSTSLEATLPEVNSDLNLINCNSIKQEEDVQWSLATNADLSWIKQEKMSNKTLSAIDENEDESDEDDDDDESFYGDYDASDLIGATTSDDVNNKWSLNMGRSRKGNEKRYFWQYNVQAKGPKGPRIGSISASASFDEDSDPHVFNDISDPVFAPDCQVEGVKHSGKARRGDGNDLTPNPKKLLMIGLELKKLSKTINDLTPVTDLPFLCRNKSRKEKNKLASRACRLKKKAQHEANKIKLHGLHREHSKMMKIINEIRQVVMLGLKIKESNKPVFFVGEDYSVPINALSSIPTLVDRIKNANKPIRDIAGHTADFVNHVLDNVSAGITSGGLENV